MTRRLVVVLAALAVIVALGGGHNPPARSEGMPSARVATQPVPNLQDLFDSYALAGGPCAPFGMYEADGLKQCEKECQGNRKRCVKKEMCGDAKCPSPGYCYACVKS